MVTWGLHLDYGASLVAQMERICLQCRRPGFNPWLRKILWRRAWQPTPVFLPGEFHGQRSLVGYIPRGHKESDVTESLALSLSPHWDSILSEFDVRHQWVIVVCYPFSRQRVWLSDFYPYDYLTSIYMTVWLSLTSNRGTVLRASWEPACWVIILDLAQIKFSFIPFSTWWFTEFLWTDRLY